MKILNTIVGLLFIPLMVLADTPPPGTVSIKGGTDGTRIGNTGDALKITGTSTISGPVTANQGNAGVQSWLTNITNASLAVTQSGTWTVQQGTPPWSISLPANAAQESGGHLASIDTKLTSPLAVTGTFWQATQPVSAASLPLPANAAQETGGHLASIDSKITTTANGIKTDGSGVTQPVSGTVTATQASGASLHVNVDSAPTTAVTQSGSWSNTVTQSSGANLHVNVDSAPTTTVTGTLTVNQGTSPWITTANIGTTNGLALDSSIQSFLGSPTGGTAAVKSGLFGGIYNTSLPTLTNGQQSGIQLDSSGRIIIRPLTSADVVSAAQSGAWSVAVNNFPATVAVTQSTSPWVTSSSQSGAWNVGINNYPDFFALSGNPTPSKVLYVGGTTQGGAILPLQFDSTNANLQVIDPSSSLTGSSVPTYASFVGGTDGTNLKAFSVDSNGKLNINNISGIISLPTGAATAAGLSTINTTLGSPFQSGGSIGNTSFQATQTTASSLNATVVGPSGVALAKDSSLSTINTTLGSPMQNSGGSVTANAGTNLNTSLLSLESGGNLAAINGKLNSLGQKTMANSVPVVIASDQSAVAVSGTVTATNSANGNTGSAVPAQATQVGGTDGTNLRALSVDSTGKLNINNISGTVSLPTGAATAAGLTTINSTLGSPMQNSGGTVTVTQATGTNLHTTVDNFPATVAVTQSTSPWITTANIGTTNGLALDASVQSFLGSATGGTAATKSGLFGGIYNTSLPTLTNGQQSSLQFDSNGRLIIRPLTSADVVSAAQSGTWTVGLSTGSNTIGKVDQGTGGASAWKVDGSAVTQPVSGTFFQATQPISAASLPLPSGASTSAKQPALGTAGTPSADVITVQGIASMTALKVDGSAVTQPVSGTVTANLGTIAGVSTAANQTTVGSQTTKINDGTTTATVKAASTAAVATDTALVVAISPNNSITASNPSVSATGAAVPAQATMVGGTDGTNLRAVKVSATGVVSVDGSATTQPVSGTVAVTQSTSPWITTANIGTTNGLALDATLTGGTQKTQVIDGAGVVVATNYGTAANAHRVAAQIGNASAVADFNAGTTGAQTLRVAANSYDGSGTALTSSTFNSKTGQSSIVSGQDILTVTGSGSALNGDAIASTDVAAYRDISLQIVVTGTNTTTFQGSNDNFTNTFSVLCITTASNSTSPSATTTATILVHCPVTYRYFRARITAFTSGTSAGTAIMSPLPPASDLGQRVINPNGGATFTVDATGQTLTTALTSGTSTTDVSSSARTTTGNSGSLTPGTNTAQAKSYSLQVTAVSGTTPTMDVVLQESWDTGTTWEDVYHWPRVTAAVQINTEIMVRSGNRYRFVWTIAGTTPSFTFAITSIFSNMDGSTIRNFFDRTINPNSGGSATPTFRVEGCQNFQVFVNMAAGGTPPTFDVYFSPDNVNYADSGITITPAVGANTTTAQANVLGKYAQIQTKTAGVASTLGFVNLRCAK